MEKTISYLPGAYVIQVAAPAHVWPCEQSPDRRKTEVTSDFETVNSQIRILR